MKLKTLLYIKEMWMPGNLSSKDSDLVPWNGIKEGNGWFLYNGSNDYQQKESYCSVCITEGEGAEYWLEIKTGKLRKPNDTHNSYRNRVRQYTEKVGRAWITAAKRLYKEPKSVSECDNKVMRNWQEAFGEALDDPKLKTFIKNCGEGKRPRKDVAPVMDPVNLYENIIKGTNLPETIIEKIGLGEITDAYDVIEELDQYAESFGISQDDPLIKATWAWFKDNEEKLLK